MTAPMIRTPDHRLRVFVSSTLQELADERRAVRDAVRRLRLAPVMFEAGARPHPPRDLYRSYLAQSHVFVGIYWQSYGWVAPDEAVSGLEDEYRLSGQLPKLIYVKTPAPERQPRLAELLARIQEDDRASYRTFGSADELGELVENDLALLLTERFEQTVTPAAAATAPTAAAGKDATTPPERARAGGAIPRSLTAFIGRERVVADARSLLDISNVRLLTLSGPGGIGKSRVAAEVARQLSEAGHDVHWLDLSALSDPVLVAPALRRSLGVDAGGEDDPADTVVQALGACHRALLLVLDGFEHVAGAAPLVTRVLDECPAVRFLVTSREVLNLRAEFEFPVPPLSTGPTGDAATRSEAVRLFMDTAQAVAPLLSITGPELVAVVEICRRLDGLPLAIELAAARARTLPPSAILGRLGDRLGFLTGGPEDAPERQRTLRATLAWDYDLLVDAERLLFRRLGVAVGGCSLELAEHLAGCTGRSSIDPLDVVDSLVRKSLLRPADEGGDEPRFDMLDTVREYAQDRLAHAGESATVRQAHAEFCLSLLDRAVLEGPETMRWMRQLDRDRHNLRAALDWAVETGSVDLELRLCAGLAEYWAMHGYLVEGNRRLEHAVAVSDGRQDALRLKMLGRASHMARARGDYRRGAELAQQVLALATVLDDRRAVAHSHSDIAACAAELLDLATAEREFRAALDAWSGLGDPMRIASMHNNLAVVAELRGNLAAAESGYLQALPVYLAHREQTLLARAETNLGRTLLARGDDAPALRLLARAMAHWRYLDNMWDLVDCLEFYGPALGRAGLAEAGLRALAVADQIRRRIAAVRPPYLQPFHDELLSELRAALPPDQYDAAWAAAGALDSGEGVDEALAVAPDERLLAVPDWDIDAELLHEQLGGLRVPG